MSQKTKRYWMLALVLLLGLQMFPMSGGMAAVAEGTVYYVKVQGNDDNSGTTWDDAFATLQKALESVQSGDQIWIAKGTYYPTKESLSSDTRTKTFQMKNGVEIYGGYSGIGTERNVADYETILSGDIGVVGDPTDNAYHVFKNRDLDQTAKLDGVTVTAGYASGYYVDDKDGGGMYNYQSSPTLHDVTFIGNTAIRLGGGLANNRNSSPELVQVVLKENEAQEGGGMQNSEGSNPELTQVKISKNRAKYNGGGISNYKSNPTLTDMEISGNKADTSGGGLYNFESSPVLTRVEIKNNEATGSGGGVHNTAGGNPVFSDVKIIENESTSGYGGGMANYSSDPTLTDVVIYLNHAGDSGGGLYHSSTGGVFTNVTIGENTAIERGGGLFFGSSKSTLSHVEIRKNKAKNGGGIYHSYSNDVYTDVKIHENQATVDGGGILNYGASPVLSRAEVKGNSAGNYGGGIYSNGGTNVLTNAEISRNRANVSGGGMYNFSGKPVLTNVTISGNEADVSGGGIFTWASTSGTIRNSIVWGNEGDDIYYYSGSIQLSHSLVGTDPKFIDFAQGNYRLSAGSPAINQGSTQYYDAGLTPDLSSITTDMDDNSRSVGDSIDMGAYEYQDNEARLNSLLVRGDNKTLTLTPEFSSVVESYRAFVDVGVTQIKLTPVMKDPSTGGEMRINGGTWTSIVSGVEQELQQGNDKNEIEIQVTAKDGTVKMYTVTIDSLPKPDLTVSHSDWTNQDVTITATNREEGAKLEYSTDGQNWLPNPDVANPNSIVITAEGDYPVYIRQQADAAHSISEVAEARVRIDKTAPVITLNGNAVQSVHRGSPFSDPGAQVTDNLDPNPHITVTGTVDTSKLGDYILTYQVTDHAGNQAVPVIRTVKVVREDALIEPTISLSTSGWTAGEVEVSISGEADALVEYSLDGQQWVTYVGPITIQDENQTKIYARQTDALQNVSDVAEAEIRIDKTAPVISLNGAATTSVYRGSTFTDPGVTITDNIATSLTPVVTGTVDTTRLGTYTLQYDTQDWAGNQAAPVTRTVRVINRPVTPPTPVTVPVTGVTLSPQTWTLTLGEEPVTLHATIAPSNATNQAVSWSSSNPSVAVVDENGSVIAKRAGQATIVVTTIDGSKTASSEVTVVEEGEGKLQLEISPASIRLSPGDTKSFKVYAVEGKERTEITKDKDTHYEVDLDLVTVKSGRITAGKKTGKAHITVRYQGAEATIAVTVEKEDADRITLKASDSLMLIEPDLTVGFQIYAVGHNWLKNITYDKDTSYSIDEDLATVTAGRINTGKQEGETELTIHYLGEELTIPVVISKISVRSLTASPRKVLLGLEEEETLNIQATFSNKQEKDVTELVKWSSTESGIVEVTEDGTIIPLKKGKTILTARYGGRDLNISVQVVDEKKPLELRANHRSLTLSAEESDSVNITVVYEGNYKEDVTKEVEWSTDNSKIAKVKKGVITGISAGQTTIRATYAGKELEISITVKE